MMGCHYPKKLYFLFFLSSLLSLCAPLQAALEKLEIVVVSKIPHDPFAYTQGLAIEEDSLYESTGLHGQSSLRCIDIASGKILKKHDLPPNVFAEGIAAFPGRLLQITWKEQQAFAYQRSSFELLKILSYQGDGWGLCRDKKSVWMSNGTATLSRRDPETLDIQKKLIVRYGGRPLNNLNDLECVDTDLYANVWMKSIIVRIDKLTGDVTGLIDASNLLSSVEKSRLGRDDVLNGIAYRPKTKTFFITGKRWPWIFEVVFEKKQLAINDFLAIPVNKNIL